MKSPRIGRSAARVATVLALFAGTLALNNPGHADIGARRITTKPAATLLLPYFEVGLNRGPNTIFSFGITGTQDPDVTSNNGPSAGVAHTTIWSNLGIPVFAFDSYLTGYDTQTVDLRQVLQGHLPRTADAGADNGDKTSPKGQISQDINFPGVSGPGSPCDAGGVLDPAPDVVRHVQAALTGAQSPLSGKCYCIGQGDQIARGYITIDTVTDCTNEFPNSPAYFSGQLDTRDLFWGNYRITGTNFSDEMVHIRAHFSDPLVATSGNYTFYGRSNAFTASDRRQPLATKFAAHYRNTPGSRGTKTTLFVWRDTKEFPDASGFTCGSPPAFFPLAQEELVAFDDQENPFDLSGTPFGRATQKVVVGSADLPIVPTNGWLYLNLNHTGAQNPSGDVLAAQSWVTLQQRAGSGAPFNSDAIPLDSAVGATHVQVVP